MGNWSSRETISGSVDQEETPGTDVENGTPPSPSVTDGGITPSPSTTDDTMPLPNSGTPPSPFVTDGGTSGRTPSPSATDDTTPLPNSGTPPSPFVTDGGTSGRTPSPSATDDTTPLPNSVTPPSPFVTDGMVIAPSGSNDELHLLSGTDGMESLSSPDENSVHTSSSSASSPHARPSTANTESLSNSASPPIQRVSRQERRRWERRGKKNKAPPINVDNVVCLLDSSMWKELSQHLFIPGTAVQSIEADCSTEVECLRAAVRYWLLRDPFASWRRLISRLYKFDAGVAEQIKSYAEKITDPTLTCSNVLDAVKTVHVGRGTHNASRLETCLITPATKMEEFQTKFPEEQKYREQIVKYWLKTSPYASWEELGRELNLYGHKRALKKVKKYIKPFEDPSLNLDNLTEIMTDMTGEQFLSVYLGIPKDAYNKLEEKYFQNREQRLKAYWEWYLNNHPAPSWRNIAESLYRYGNHAILEVLREKIPYVRGSMESRRVFAAAMKLGHVQSQTSKFLMYGAAGTGKSSFMDLLIDNPPSDIRRSTPLAARPVTLFQIDVASMEWVKLSPKEKREVLVRAAMSMQTLSDSGSEGSSSEGDSLSDHDMPEVTESVVTKGHSSERVSTQDAGHRLHPVALPPVTPEHIDGSGSAKHIRQSIDKLVDLVELCSRTDKAVTSYHKLYLIDSGGQPQFHEILPVFLRRMGLYVFVFKLSEELAAKPVVEYFDSSGRCVGTPYQSSQSNEQILKHCLRTMRTHRLGGSKDGGRSRVMIIGTHRDLEEQCTTETREEKNVKLAKLLFPTFKKEVLYYNLHNNEFIFPVNAKDPSTEDKALADSIRKLLLTECIPDPVDVPLQYYGLEILLEEVSLALGRGVLSFSECLEAAAELHFNKHSLDAALQFLDEIAVLFFFPEVLEGVIFTNSQVLLDKVTELVEKIHSLRKSDGSRCPLSGEWQGFRDHALFTLEFLQKQDFQKHYVPGLFTPTELVKLFQKLLIIAQFSSTEYFMPALLPVLGDNEVSDQRVPQDSPAAALALDFPLGGPRLGTYCTLTCFLVSHNNQFPCPWEIELLPDSNIPACLYRNCTRFSIPGYPGCVTLIDTFTHFEVHISTASKVCHKMCSHARKAILAGIKKAALTLGYLDFAPTLTMLCPCGVGGVHVASLGDGLWTCKRNRNKFGDLASNYEVWLDSEPSSIFKDSRPTFQELLCLPTTRGPLNLAEEVGTDYWQFGVLLLDDKTGARVSAIEKELGRNASNINCRVFQMWLSGKGRQPVSWDTLVTVLQDSGLNMLAESIRQKSH